MLRSGVTRAVAVLGVIAGVFAMHALTGNHDAAMAAEHLNVAPRAMVLPAGHQQMDHAGPAQTRTLAPTNEKPAGEEHPAFAPLGGHHSMGGVCLAVLTGLVLLLALALALRSLSAWRSVRLFALAEPPVLTGRSPPWLVPSLSKLCVLRI
ncbi:hypothetical protein EV643_11237 [Kribbella sp. VKM Ac-2527]|uniref:Uncharacterized protein n=2 Tax=Kribbella caucasensis TaxID=2512215 RepID=A0A4R6K7S1_9ACTN|nr:hypothetical protein EV643_11237 [Kribbella sp. VKM Ac-2527]